MSDDEIKDKDHEEEAEENENPGEGESEEHGPDSDFASSNAAVAPSFDDAGDDSTTGDFHEDAFNQGSRSEDPHDDIYGDAGAPKGFGGEDEEEDGYGDDEEEDMDGFSEDSDAY